MSKDNSVWSDYTENWARLTYENVIEQNYYIYNVTTTLKKTCKNKYCTITRKKTHKQSQRNYLKSFKNDLQEC